MFEELVLEEYREWDKTHSRAISHEEEEAILKAIASKTPLPEEWKGRRDGVGLGNVIYFERSRCVASNPISHEEVVVITSIYYDFQYKMWECSCDAWPFRAGEKLPFTVFSLRKRAEGNPREVRRKKRRLAWLPSSFTRGVKKRFSNAARWCDIMALNIEHIQAGHVACRPAPQDRSK